MRRGQGRFQVVEYTGEDAAEVLAKIMNGMAEESEEHETESDTEVARTVGFQPNPKEGNDEPNPD